MGRLWNFYVPRRRTPAEKAREENDGMDALLAREDPRASKRIEVNRSELK